MSDKNIKHRFIGDFDLDKSILDIKNETVHNYATSVLRLQKGDWIVLGDGSGWEAEAKVLGITGDNLRVEVGDPVEGRKEPEAGVVLFSSIVKRGHFEEAARMATQVGVEAIVPVVSQRTVKTGLKEDRLERIVLNAAEQSGRSIRPEVASPVDFKESFDLVEDLSYIFVHPGEGEHIMDMDLEKTPTGIFIGPEGGWTREEVEFARDKGARFAHLGKPILKNETAAAITPYIVINRLR